MDEPDLWAEQSRGGTMATDTLMEEPAMERANEDQVRMHMSDSRSMVVEVGLQRAETYETYVFATNSRKEPCEIRASYLNI